MASCFPIEPGEGQEGLFRALVVETVSHRQLGSSGRFCF